MQKDKIVLIIQNYRLLL